jgi:GT2 family glycosyltransferase
LNECPDRNQALYAAIAAALEKNDCDGALKSCDELLQAGADANIDSLRKHIMNKSKDDAINANIRRFIAAGHGPLPPRETVFRPEIIIPCFNQGRFLADALASLPPGVPVTVVNDASTDDTAEYIGALQKLFSFKLLANETNLNQGGSLNRAVAASGNNLFIVLNADDALVRYAVPAVTAALAGYPDVRMVGGDCIPFDDSTALERNRRLPAALPCLPEPKIFLPAQAREFQHPNDINMTMSGCSFLRSAWEAAGGFREFAQRVCSFDDRDFQMRVCALFPVAVFQEPLAFYRVNSSVGRGRSL